MANSLWDAPAGSHGSCIQKNESDLTTLNTTVYHVLQMCLIEGIEHLCTLIGWELRSIRVIASKWCSLQGDCLGESSFGKDFYRTLSCDLAMEQNGSHKYLKRVHHELLVRFSILTTVMDLNQMTKFGM